MTSVAISSHGGEDRPFILQGNSLAGVLSATSPASPRAPAASALFRERDPGNNRGRGLDDARRVAQVHLSRVHKRCIPCLAVEADARLAGRRAVGERERETEAAGSARGMSRGKSRREERPRLFLSRVFPGLADSPPGLFAACDQHGGVSSMKRVN